MYILLIEAVIEAFLSRSPDIPLYRDSSGNRVKRKRTFYLVVTFL